MEDIGGRCIGEGCKKNAARFGFCAQHYDYYKFGLMRKDGKLVSDYDKKFGHYQAHLKKARKVA